MPVCDIEDKYIRHRHTSPRCEAIDDKLTDQGGTSIARPAQLDHAKLAIGSLTSGGKRTATIGLNEMPETLAHRVDGFCFGLEVPQ